MGRGLKLAAAVALLHLIEHRVRAVERAFQRGRGRSGGGAGSGGERRDFLRGDGLHGGRDGRFSQQDEVDQRDAGEEEDVFHPCWRSMA